MLQHVITQTERVENRIRNINDSAAAHTGSLVPSPLIELPQPPLIQKHPATPTTTRLDPGGVQATLAVESSPRIVLEEGGEEDQGVVSQDAVPGGVVEGAHLRWDYLSLQVEGTVGVEEEVG